MSNFECDLPFDTTDPEFVRGFEVGALWERLRTDELPHEQVCHASNAEMCLRLAEATNRELHVKELGETWIETHFTRPRS